MKTFFERENSNKRAVLRAVGWLVSIVGGVFAAVGFIDFFSAFGGDGMPTKFWCAFVGLPMLVVGLSCLRAGYLRTINSYFVGESAPAVADAARTVAKQWREGTNEADAGEKTDAAQRMRQLESLKDSGLISSEEYRVKRAEILRAL